jgi:SAM-dependent methyltransferase
MTYRDEFDCAVFFDSLHHAEDEVAALKSVYNALRPGGVLVLSEPGKGHGTSAEAKEAMEKFGVTERDMPPALIVKAAKLAGFTSAKVFADIGLIHRAVYKTEFTNRRLESLLNNVPFARLMLTNYLTLSKHTRQGIVVLKK